MKVDVRLNGIVDPERANGRSLVELTRLVVAGGATLIQLLGPKAIIGLSIKSVALANAAPLDVLDYVGVGGVYATASKDNPNPPIGVVGLGDIVAALRARKRDLPVCGIAGIDATNAAPVIGAGADGVAVISALSMQADPQAAARALRGIVDAALKGRPR